MLPSDLPPIPCKYCGEPRKAVTILACLCCASYEWCPACRDVPFARGIPDRVKWAAQRKALVRTCRERIEQGTNVPDMFRPFHGHTGLDYERALSQCAEDFADHILAEIRRASREARRNSQVG